MHQAKHTHETVTSPDTCAPAPSTITQPSRPTYSFSATLSLLLCAPTPPFDRRRAVWSLNLSSTSSGRHTCGLSGMSWCGVSVSDVSVGVGHFFVAEGLVLRQLSKVSSCGYAGPLPHSKWAR